jgi:hypothetical protein
VTNAQVAAAKQHGYGGSKASAKLTAAGAALHNNSRPEQLPPLWHQPNLLFAGLNRDCFDTSPQHDTEEP